MSVAEPTRTAPLALWRAAGDLLRTIFNLFGAPEDIAAAHTFTAKSHARLLSWLRTAEALLRRLIFIEASTLVSTTHGPPASSRHARNKREPKRMEFFADKPETWRVSFRCFASTTALRQAQGSSESDSPSGLSPSKATGATRRFLSAWPLAERAEALLRAYNNPAPYAQRLARRLRAKPTQTTALLKHPEDLPHRFGDVLFLILTAACEVAQLAFDSS